MNVNHFPLNFTLSVIRHGFSESNAQYIECADLSNRSLFGLTQEGVSQMKAAKSQLPELDAIYCSPLLRAVQSAKILAKRTSVEPIENPLLIEQNVGIFELKPESERRSWKEKHRSSHYPGGESPEMVEARGVKVLTLLNKHHRGQHVLLVTHNMFLRCLTRVLFKGDVVDELAESYFSARKVLTLPPTC